MAKKWTAQDLPALSGRIAVVTGANRGLGLEIAAALAGAGAEVVLACRDVQRGQAAVAQIRAKTPAAQLQVMTLDLADLASVRSFAQGFAQRFARLDILCNNGSAIMVPQLGRTRDGFELQLGTNHLGHFALVGLLLERLRAAPAARVVGLSSMAHRLTKGLDFEDPQFLHKPYKPMDGYGKSKLAVLTGTFELDRRLRKAGLPIVAVAAHPGWSNTNPGLGGWSMRLATRLFAQPPAMGALPALYAAAAPDVRGGEYFGPGGMKELGGWPKRVGCRPEARDAALGARLWALSEELTGVRYLD